MRGGIMGQISLLDIAIPKDKNKINIGSGLDIEIIKRTKVTLYKYGTFVKAVNLLDRPAKRLFITEAVEMGAIKHRLASTLSISRQSIDNYIEAKKHFGLEGLVHSFVPAKDKNLRDHRQEHSQERHQGNKSLQLAQIHQKALEEKQENQVQYKSLFDFDFDKRCENVENTEQPFSEEHEWESTRYAGIFCYLIPLITEWKWLGLVMGHFGSAYKIFMIFLLMVTRNIRSIEQLKNICTREAGIVLGIRKIPCKPKVWLWFYLAVQKQVSKKLIKDYFGYQIRKGIVGLWLWFTDGHLLPYTGKEKVHFAYNTQRRMPFPGQTNLVTCDGSGRIVDFEIQEGKGDLRSHIVNLCQKWKGHVSELPIMVFDREGSGNGFFSGLVLDGIPFVTWEKHADSVKLAAIEKEKFTEEFELNGKKYGIFEGEKTFEYIPEQTNVESHSFTLRRIYLWNKTAGRRTCGLAWDGKKGMSTKDCALAILSRWGASENTFKHINNRHPLHYHPGFKLTKSEHQEIANPAIKEKQGLINGLEKDLGKLYKKITKTKEEQEGQIRKNSVRERLKEEIQKKEGEKEQLKEEKGTLPERVNVSSLEDYRSFKQIDNEGKYLFDFVTSSVWNARKQIVEWLQPFFNQKNELVDLFYAITDCHGWIKSTKKEVIVRLEPLQQPKRRLAQEQLCRKLTNLGAQIPIGKYLVIEIGASPLSKK